MKPLPAVLILATNPAGFTGLTTKIRLAFRGSNTILDGTAMPSPLPAGVQGLAPASVVMKTVGASGDATYTTLGLVGETARNPAFASGILLPVAVHDVPPFVVLNTVPFDTYRSAGLLGATARKEPLKPAGSPVLTGDQDAAWFVLL